MKTSYLAFGTIALGFAGLIVACGGAEEKDVLNGTPSQATASSSGIGSTSGNGSSSGTGSSTSSSSSGSTSGSSSSGSTSSSTGGTTDACVPCPTPAPDGCTYPDPCSCRFECPSGPVKCVYSASANTCPDGYYCEAPNCQQGVCVRKGENETPNRDPQCGCNGVTYWNLSVARKAGQPVRNNGACRGDNAARCGGFAPTPCPNGSTCNMQVDKKSECGQSDGSGVCWGVPEKCPTVVVGGRARACGPLGACGDECTAVKKALVWYDDNTCPQ